jgi:subtilisin family serine protease
MFWHYQLPMTSLLGAVLLVGIAYASPRPTASQSTSSTVRATPRHAKKYVPDQLLVRFRPGLSKQAMRAQHAQVGAAVLKEFRVVENLQLVRLPANMTVGPARRLYRARPDVLYAEPNYYRYAVQSPLIPNDPLYPDMWNLHNTGQSGGTSGADVHAPEAWGLSTGSSSVVVAVIDTGIAYNHSDLAANVWSSSTSYTVTLPGGSVTCASGTHGFNAITMTCDPKDDTGHGTHVAGTIGASGNNGTGVVGVNWQAQVMACKFLDANGGGTTSDLITCLEYVALMKDSGVNLVATNNSYGGFGFSQAEMDAIDTHRQRGILFVAAAGNDHTDNDFRSIYPVNYGLPNMLAVAATDRNDALADFSNFGRHTVHLCAPGKEILSTIPPSDYAVNSGTSMATPHVTGVAALLKAQDSTRDWKAIKNLILAGGDTVAGASETVSQKRLNAYGAMTCSNSVVQTRLLPLTDDAYVSAGDSLTFRALNINCALPNGTFELRVDGGSETIIMSDDGSGLDLEANDGLYVAQRKWFASEIGDHTVTFPNNDIVTIHVVPPLSTYTYSTTVPFNYREIEGTDLHMGDPGSVVIRPPFPVRFGGASFPTLNVNGYGNITLFGPFLDSDNSPLPTASVPTLIAPFWDALIMYPGTVQWAVTGDAPNRELVIEWRGLSHFECFDLYERGGDVTFQVVFFEGSSDILFNYADVVFGPFNFIDGPCLENANEGRSATVGIQSGPGLANQFSFNTSSLTNNFSILWRIGPLIPSITRLSPFSALAGEPDISLQVIGRSFRQGAVVRWEGNDRQTTYVHASELTATIPASDLASAGIANVTVINPPSDGGESTPAPFTVYSSYPIPTLTGITPNPFSTDWTMLMLTGTNFVSASGVRWNGADRPISDWFGTVISSTQIEMKPYAVDTWSAGTAQVTVFNPAPGGGTSNALTLSINNPVPSLIGSEPATTYVGGPAFTLHMYGFNFTQASVLRWNGSDRPTSHPSPPNHRFYLSAAIPAADIASAGTAQLTVFTPTPGGGASDPITVSILEPPFTMVSDSPARTVSRGTPAIYTITITPQLGGFNDPIALSCSVVPAGPTCSLSESSVTPGAAAHSVTLTVATTNVAHLKMPGRTTPLLAFWIALPTLGLLAIGTMLPGQKRTMQGIFLALVLTVVSLGILVACGGGGGGTSPPPPPHNFTITVVGTSGTISQQTSTSLTVTF